MTEKEIVRQDQSDFKVIFIHSEIDDFGLTPNQFRIYAHIARRANRKKECWPSIPSMAETCRMHPDSVRAALTDLEKFGLLIVQRNPGRSSFFILNGADEWKPELVPQPDGKRGRNSSRPSETNGGVSDTTPPKQMDTTPPKQMDTTPPKQMDRKVLHEVDPVRKSILARSGSTGSSRTAKPDTDYLAELQASEPYRELNVVRELGKLEQWCKANGKLVTRRRLVNWLNRADIPIAVAKQRLFPAQRAARIKELEDRLYYKHDREKNPHLVKELEALIREREEESCQVAA